MDSKRIYGNSDYGKATQIGTSSPSDVITSPSDKQRTEHAQDRCPTIGRNGRRDRPGRSCAVHQSEEQRRSSQSKGDDRTMTSQTFQQGSVEEIRTNKGLAHKIRYRVRRVDGTWKQRSETLYGLSGVKAAKAVIRQRTQKCFTSPIELRGHLSLSIH
jgi:hypothetical protein